MCSTFRKKLKTIDFGDLIDKINSRLDGWSNRYLNTSGMLELSIPWSIQLFNSGCKFVKYLRQLYKKIEHIWANFLWQGKHHKINWQTVSKPKAEGGLGIRNLDELEKDYAIKLSKLYMHQNTLWATWMQKRYRNNKLFWMVSYDNNSSFI